ncbi:MAG TPA: hypothetical protein PLZ32_06765 [Saprospiraceae bacterium]|nr:hypothetical protein [Saprospiraceae bacterium]
MKHRLLLLFFSPILFWGCFREPAQKIVDTAIEYQNGNLLDKSSFSFQFRDKEYISTRNSGNFTYQRKFKDSLGLVEDILTNETFIRKIDGKKVEVDQEWKTKYSNSINSVFYFVYLPFGLNDKAVIKEFLGNDTINGLKYDCIKISFNTEGGGTDHDDIFYYWFQTETKSMDYFAYSYQTDGGGIRFRKAYNQRRINKVIFQDYINLSPEKSIEKSTKIEEILALYKANKLVELSKIETEQITF